MAEPFYLLPPSVNINKQYYTEATKCQEEKEVDITTERSERFPSKKSQYQEEVEQCNERMPKYFSKKN